MRLGTCVFGRIVRLGYVIDHFLDCPILSNLCSNLHASGAINREFRFRLRRKHGVVLYRRNPAALSLEVFGCAVGVCAHASLLPHQYVAVQMLPAPCRKLHAFFSVPGQFLKTVETDPTFTEERLNVILKTLRLTHHRMSAAGEFTIK